MQNVKTKIAALGIATMVIVGGLVLTDSKTTDKSKPSYYAEIAEDGTVLRVIVASPAFIESGALQGTWVETAKDGKIRKNPAGIGDKYDPDLDAFVAPKPTADATLDTRTAKWIVPEKVKEELPVISATST